jgi:hypothetical protein
MMGCNDEIIEIGHSIPKGAAVSAIVNGIAREDVKKMGRWKSDVIQAYEVDSIQHLKNMIKLNRELPVRRPLAPSYPPH